MTTQNTQLTPMQQIGVSLKQQETRLMALLPQNCTPQRFIQIVGNAIIKNPYLLKLDKTSIVDSCLKCAEDGLLPDGREAALVPFGNKVQYMPMIGGILKKIRNSGELLSISACIVYNEDEFTFCLGDNEQIIHIPNLDADTTKIKCVYAIAKTKDGGIYREVMTISQINAIRNKSIAYNAYTSGKVKTSIWNDHWEEMAKKTVIRRLSKRLPMSTDLVEIITRDDNLHVTNIQENKPKSIFDDFKADAIDTESIKTDDDFDIDPEIIKQAEELAKDKEAAN